jgi:diacylglycerol kinase
MIKTFLYAIAGVVAAVKGERNMRIHVVAAVAAISLGAWLGVPTGSDLIATVDCHSSGSL